MRDTFSNKRRWGLTVATDNLTYRAGNIRLFTTNGPVIFTYDQINKEWSLRRVWHFYFFAIHHVSPGKSTCPRGWNVTWAKLKFKKEYKGFSVHWQWADTFRVK